MGVGMSRKCIFSNPSTGVAHVTQGMQKELQTTDLVEGENTSTICVFLKKYKTSCL
jgi:hypothetical protein